MMRMPPHLTSGREIARQHGLRPSTVDHWVRVGKLPVVRAAPGTSWDLAPYVHARTALDRAGVIRLHQLAALPWPSDVCERAGLVPVAMVAEP